MADDILGDLLRSHEGPGEAPRPSGFGELVARSVASGRSVSPQASAPPDLSQLLALDESSLARLLRLLPAEALVPLLARAPVPVAERIVGILDAESQAWLAAQSDAIEACTPEAHAAAARRALALVEKARGGPAQAASAVPPPAPATRPVQLGMQFGVEAAAQPPAAAAVPTPAPAQDDDLIGTLASLVALAAGRDAAQLREIAASVDHPVLAAGLGSVAAGGDAHVVDETVRGAGHDWLAAQSRQVELMRLAVLAIRFGDGPQRFREQAARL